MLTNSRADWPTDDVGQASIHYTRWRAGCLGIGLELCGLELRYAPDGELRSSQVHRDAAALAADAHGKRSEMESRVGWRRVLYQKTASREPGRENR